MPTYASGLSAQLMLKAETTWGTPVTVDTGFEFLSEGLQHVPTFIDGAGLRAGQAYKRISRTVISRVDVNGDLTVEHSDKGHMALLWKHALGSALTVPVVIGATTAFESYLVNGSKAGFGLTMQVGRPQVSGPTVQPFTYEGVKVTGWEFSINDNQYAQLKLTLDGQQEVTATSLVGASYTAGAGIFSFIDASVFKIGGTASTTSGKTTIASGVSVASIVKGITITCTTPMAEDRYGLGNAGQKAEPIENAIPTIMVKLDCEFTNRTELYDLFKAGTNTVLQLDLTHFDNAGKDAGGVTTGPNPYLLSFILPALKIKTGAMNVTGPDVVQQSIEMESYDDGSGTNPVIQVHLVSTDTLL